MSDNVKMFARYGLAILIGWLVGAGKITPEQGDTYTKLAIELVGILAAFAPALYAAKKIDNGPIIR
jgi:hypothetical protein